MNSPISILKVETNEFEIKNSLKKNKCDYENQVIISYLENCLPAEELLEFEQKATPKGYSALNISLLDNII